MEDENKLITEKEQRERLLEELKKQNLSEYGSNLFRRFDVNHSAIADDVLKVLFAHTFEVNDMEIVFTIARFKITGVLDICTKHDGYSRLDS